MIRVVPRMPFRGWSQAVDAGEMDSHRAKCAIVEKAMRRYEAQMDAVLRDMLVYGSAAYTVDENGDVRLVPRDDLT